MPRRPHIFAITAGVALASVNLLFLALFYGWFGPFQNAGCKFCETMRPGLIKQPANTWSNLGFVAAGLSMAWQLAVGQFASNRNALTRSSFIATAMSCLAVLLGPGSMALHASATELGGFIDVLSMYLVASFLVSYSARRLFRFKTIYFALVFCAALTVCLWANSVRGVKFLTLSMGNTAFAFFLTATAMLEFGNLFWRKLKQTDAWGYASMASILTAFTIWNLSVTNGPWCAPDSWVQGHAAWHLLDALSLYCLFRFYVSESEAE